MSLRLSRCLLVAAVRLVSKRFAQKAEFHMDMRTMEMQMDALYSLVLVRHTEVLTGIYSPQHKRDRDVLKSIAASLAATLDSLEFCSEQFCTIKEAEGNLTGQDIVSSQIAAKGWIVDGKPVRIATDGENGEQYLTLQD